MKDANTMHARNCMAGDRGTQPGSEDRSAIRVNC
jgi:hypothetical protein